MIFLTNGWKGNYLRLVVARPGELRLLSRGGSVCSLVQVGVSLLGVPDVVWRAVDMRTLADEGTRLQEGYMCTTSNKQVLRALICLHACLPLKR